MAQYVTSAFSEFIKDKVNLDPNKSTTAKSSRDWLVEKIISFQTDPIFPKLYTEMNIFYGSFDRKTKIRPLDDIDIMIALSSEDGAWYETQYDKTVIHVLPTSPKLSVFRNLSDNTLNSTKVINAFKTKLQGIPQYKNAEIKKNGAACTLQLSSYDWNFDIVPCFYTTAESDGKRYYLIPDGYGNWKKTDPRIDKQYVTNLNQRHDGNLLNIIRTTKYWQKRPTMPTMQSYLLETMVLKYYDHFNSKASAYVDTELPNLFAYIAQAVYLSVNDIKGISGNLNNLGYSEMIKISQKAQEDYHKAFQATEAERNQDMKLSIRLWGEILGGEFPVYG